MVISLYQDLSEIKIINHTFQRIQIHWSLILKVLTVRLMKPRTDERFFLDKFFDDTACSCTTKKFSLTSLICSCVRQNNDSFPLKSYFVRYIHLFVNFSMTAVQTQLFNNEICQGKIVHFFSRTHEQTKIVKEQFVKENVLDYVRALTSSITPD